MKLVPLATLVHMDIKAFPSRPTGRCECFMD
ncbi:hypothetical protein T12_2601 [Trichinella patagoniensis]|uniref:Uncharacterized protein n=1 Tax=Trichinella patagoniensis TaxID=990121 RepID=A0A0V0YRY0_9BILA|nr:hypothetical protein T12_2601 [Trichinella patagoniensis]